MATNNKTSQQTQNGLELRDWLSLCLQNWYWFVISVAICCGIALFYVLRMPSVYTRSSAIMIKEDAQSMGRSSAMGASLGSAADMGMFRMSSSVTNELVAIQSPHIMLEVAKRLHLEYNYATDGTFHREVLYGQNLPITAIVSNGDSACSFTVKLEGKEIAIQDLRAKGFESNQTFGGTLGRPIKTPIGDILITPTNVKSNVSVVYVYKSTSQDAMSGCQNRFAASLHDKQSDIIDMAYSDLSYERAEDVLNMVVTVYNENWVTDKNLLAISTSKFISERLAALETDLGNVDADISNYKSENLIPDVDKASDLYMNQATSMSNKSMDLGVQLYMIRYLRNYIKSATPGKDYLPSNLGAADVAVERQISEYNKLLLQRNSLANNSSDQNPLVISLDNQMQQQFDVISTSLLNTETSLQAQLNAVNQNESETRGKIAQGPEQAKHLISVERQQKVKESLYLYLLQKLEENELSQAFTAYNTRIITPPMGSKKPTGPIRKKYMLIALALGLVIPIGIIYLMESMNTKVRGRKDMESLNIPYVGEIPLYLGHRQRHYAHIWNGFFFRWKKKEVKDVQRVVVKPHSRNIINEAFRVVRANIEFMAKDSKVMMLTSANPGSGKSFLSFNMGLSFAMKGTKVIVVDMDMRRCSLSKFVGNPSMGLSNYLADLEDDWHELLVQDERYPGLTVLPAGVIPPNPTELLYNDKLKTLMEGLRKEFDLVIVDCPPVEIVADASIVAGLVDRCVFVVRAGLFEREMLATLQELYDKNSYPNMSVLLNGTEIAYKGYGYGRYGTRYGYGYHSGYGNYANYSGYTED